MFPSGLDWSEWMQSGISSNSVWADPDLLDPSSGQYVLAQGSPALGLGIQQIQLGNFGIQAGVALLYKNN